MIIFNMLVYMYTHTYIRTYTYTAHATLQCLKAGSEYDSGTCTYVASDRFENTVETQHDDDDDAGIEPINFLFLRSQCSALASGQGNSAQDSTVSLVLKMKQRNSIKEPLSHCV